MSTYKMYGAFVRESRACMFVYIVYTYARVFVDTCMGMGEGRHGRAGLGMKGEWGGSFVIVGRKATDRD